jgi:hypothetical protein
MELSLGMSRPWLLIGLFFGLGGSVPGAWAADRSVVSNLPYATRTRGYSAYSATTRGNLRTVGMAGATLGLGDPFAAAGENPAGLALTMPVGQTYASANQVRDSNLQSTEAAIQAASVGAGLQFREWAFGLSAVNTWGEGQFYRIPDGSGGFSEPQNIDLFVREYRLGAAKRFLGERLALGAQIRFGDFTRSLGTASNPWNNWGAHSYALGLTAGALYRLPYRLFLGAALSSPMHYSGGGSPPSFEELPGLSQPARSPLKGGIGLGFIPNRIFRADFTLHFAGATPTSALLSDETRSVGESTTLEPRLGAAYIFGDFKSMRATAFGGSYLEPVRIEGTSTRLHGTGGVELKWSFLNFGLGFDVATGYRNLLATFGVDPIVVMKKLDLIPPIPTPNPKGFLPPVLYRSDEGLPPMIRERKSRRNAPPGLDPLQIGRDLPRKLGEKVRNFKPGQVIDTIRDLPSEIEDDLQEVGSEIEKKIGQ